VGGFEVTAYSGGTLLFSIPRYMAEHPRATAGTPLDETGSTRIGTNFLHVKTASASILVDPGGWSDDHVARLTDLRPVPIEDNLARLGLNPLAVTHVIVSHAHTDHFENIVVWGAAGPQPRFPNAQHFIHRRDVDGQGMSEKAQSELNAYLEPIAQAGLLTPVDEGKFEIRDGITMIHTGGETAGHCVVRFSSRGQKLFYLADLVHLPGEMLHIDWALKNRNLAELFAARRRVLTEAEEGHAILIYTHDPTVPPWGTVTSVGPNSWLWNPVS
jgi:glyoxylase-like metal-dependent hydrolase (beta-lactamase superfamily II)